MMTSKILFVVTLGATVLSAAESRANTCSWRSPYENYPPGRLYPGIEAKNHNGFPLSNPRVVVNFWGSMNPSSSCHSNRNVNIAWQLQLMLTDPNFWSRYSQYGVSTGNWAGVVYGGQFLGNLCNATLTDAEIRQELELEQYYGYLPVDFNHPYIYLVFIGNDVNGPVQPGGGMHSYDTNGYLSGYQYPYAVAQDNPKGPPPPSCPSCSPDAVDTLLAAHEAMEIATDPWGVLGTLQAEEGSPGVWAFPPTGYNFILEIGDLCNGIPVVVNGVTWQTTWHQDQCACL